MYADVTIVEMVHQLESEVSRHDPKYSGCAMLPIMTRELATTSTQPVPTLFISNQTCHFSADLVKVLESRLADRVGLTILTKASYE